MKYIHIIQEFNGAFNYEIDWIGLVSIFKSIFFSFEDCWLDYTHYMVKLIGSYAVKNRTISNFFLE